MQLLPRGRRRRRYCAQQPAAAGTLRLPAEWRRARQRHTHRRAESRVGAQLPSRQTCPPVSAARAQRGHVDVVPAPCPGTPLRGCCYSPGVQPHVRRRCWRKRQLQQRRQQADGHVRHSRAWEVPLGRCCRPCLRTTREAEAPGSSRSSGSRDSGLLWEPRMHLQLLLPAYVQPTQQSRAARRRRPAAGGLGCCAAATAAAAAPAAGRRPGPGDPDSTLPAAARRRAAAGPCGVVGQADDAGRGRAGDEHGARPRRGGAGGQAPEQRSQRQQRQQ